MSDKETLRRIKRLSRKNIERKSTKVINPKNDYNRKREKNNWKKEYGV